MKNIIEEMNNLKTEWDSLQPMNLEHQKLLWEKFRLEWNFNSNHIEGNTMTFDETELLLRLGDDFRAKDNSLKDVYEMRAHDTAIFMIRDWAQDKDHSITEKDIRELNQTILVKDFWSDAVTPRGQPTRRLIKVGKYKEQPNHVILKSGEIFKYAEPIEVPQKMQELVDWYNSINDDDPITTAAYLHYKFVLIHPFDDGNGRVSRLLMNLHLMKHGFPPLIIKSEDKKNYLYALNQADAGNFNAFVEYLATQMLWSLRISIKGAKGEDIAEKNDLFKEIEVWKKELRSELPTNPQRSDDFSLKLYDESIVKVYNGIESKIKIFEELFLSSKNTQGFYIDNGSSFFSDPPNSIDKQRIKTNKTTITAFQFRSEYKRPLKTPDNLNIKVDLAITFKLDVYDYKVIIESDVVFTKHYSSTLGQEEIDIVIEKYVSALFEKIKKTLE